MLEKLKNTITGAKGKIDELISDNMQIVTTHICFQLTTAKSRLEDTWNDDEKLSSIFCVVYDEMPLPFRLAVKQQYFVDYCLKNREKLQKLASDKMKTTQPQNKKPNSLEA